MFVRGKNTQKLGNAYLIQVFSLNMNMNSILKSIQRFRIYFNFLIFQELFLINFFVYLTFTSNCPVWPEHHGPKTPPQGPKTPTQNTTQKTKKTPLFG